MQWSGWSRSYPSISTQQQPLSRSRFRSPSIYPPLHPSTHSYIHLNVIRFAIKALVCFTCRHELSYEVPPFLQKKFSLQAKYLCGCGPYSAMSLDCAPILVTGRCSAAIIVPLNLAHSSKQARGVMEMVIATAAWMLSLERNFQKSRIETSFSWAVMLFVHFCHWIRTLALGLLNVVAMLQESSSTVLILPLQRGNHNCDRHQTRTALVITMKQQEEAWRPDQSVIHYQMSISSPLSQRAPCREARAPCFATQCGLCDSRGTAPAPQPSFLILFLLFSFRFHLMRYSWRRNILDPWSYAMPLNFVCSGGWLYNLSTWLGKF